MPDHFGDVELAPMVAISIAAAATTSLRIGTLVLGNDYKHPAVVAKEAATLDLLSDGRVELGLGAGWQTTDYDALGLALDPPATRVARLEEAIAVVKGCWGPGPFTFSGEHYRITDYEGLPKPVQQPHPPLLIGGGAPRVLRLAGREADIISVNPNLRSGVVDTSVVQSSLAAETARKIEWIRQGAGARYDDIELQVRCFFAAITDDARGLAESVAPSFGISVEDALEASVALVGTVDEVCETLQRRREQWGVSCIVLNGDCYRDFAPVVARLAGT
jgi:probable F420-dependent oxidoreductase